MPVSQTFRASLVAHTNRRYHRRHNYLLEYLSNKKINYLKSHHRANAPASHRIRLNLPKPKIKIIRTRNSRRLSTNHQRVLFQTIRRSLYRNNRPHKIHNRRTTLRRLLSIQDIRPRPTNPVNNNFHLPSLLRKRRIRSVSRRPRPNLLKLNRKAQPKIRRYRQHPVRTHNNPSNSRSAR